VSSFVFAQVKTDSSVTDIYRPGDHELLLMPSAYTMEKGQSYFSDYEIFLINYTYAITGRTQLSVLSLFFPIQAGFLQTFTMGIKQNYYRAPGVASAAWLTLTPWRGLLNIGNVLSLGSRGKSLHIGLGALTARGTEHWELTYLLGGRYDISRKFSLLAEYTNSKTGFDTNSNGFLSLGIRFRGKDIAWDFAGVRPLNATYSTLPFVPLIKATVVF